MHAVLKEGEEIFFVHPLPTARAERLNTIKEGCEKVLVDLQNLVERYESLGTQSKRTWDRMRWGNEDVAQIRARLTSNISLLTAFISTSQVSVVTKLDKFIEEFRQGKRETSIVSVQTVDSLSADDRAVWRTIRKELEEIGISVAAFDANRNFIFDWLVRAVEAGTFEEQSAPDIDDESQYSDKQACESSEADDDGDMGRQNENSDSESLKSIHGGQQPGWQPSSKSAHKSEIISSKRGSTSSNQNSASTHLVPRTKRRVPRIAAVVAGMSRPSQRLMKAVTTGDFSEALKILKDEASSHLLDTETLDRALWSTTCQDEIYDSYLLLEELITQGADVNYVSSDRSERTPLWNSVANGSFHTVLLLVENGVDVNYTGLYRQHFGGEACDFAPRAALKKNAAMLRLLISSGVDVNVQYNKALQTRHRLRARPFTYNYAHDKISLIHEAASLGAVSAIETLLDHGAEIDAASRMCVTALIVALLSHKEEAAEFLLVRGADPNFLAAPDPIVLMFRSKRRHLTPIEVAMEGGKPSMVRLLLDHGAVRDDSTLGFMGFVTESREGPANHEEDHEIIRMLEEAVEREKHKLDTEVADRDVSTTPTLPLIGLATSTDADPEQQEKDRWVSRHHTTRFISLKEIYERCVPFQLR